MSQSLPTVPWVPAGLDRRFYAFVVDRVIAWACYAAAGFAAYQLWFRHERLWPGMGLLAAVVVLVWFAYAALAGLRGTSPGKALWGLRVVDDQTGERIGLGSALLRGALVGTATLPTFGLGAATLAWTALMDPQRRRRGWHDQVAGSVVLDVRPQPVPVVVEPDRPRPIVNLTALRLRPVPAEQPATGATGTHTGTHTGSGAVGLDRARAGGPPTGAGPQPPATVPPSLPAAGPPPPSPWAPGPTPPAQPEVSAQPRQQRPSGPAPSGPTPSGPAPSGTTPPGPAPSGPTPPGPPAPGPPTPDVVRPPAGVPPTAIGRTTRRPARPPVAPDARWRVTFDTGESLVVEGLLLIGRKPEARAGETAAQVVSLVSRDMSLSKTHAQVHLADGVLVVMDRGSTNGSVLVREGVPRELSAGRPATLLEGDRVRLGDREMVVVREG